MRKFLFAMAILVGILFVISNFTRVEEVAATIERSDWRFLLIGLAVQAVWILNNAAMYREIYRALGVEEKISTLFMLASASIFVNVITPSGMVGAVTLFIDQARRERYSVARATMAGLLFVLFDYLGLICVLAFGLIVLFRRNNLDTAEIVASLILVAIALALSALFIIGMRSVDQLGKVLAWGARQINKLLRPFIRREYVSEQRGYDFARDAAEGFLELRHNRQGLLRPFALSLSSKALLVVVLFLVFVAFRTPYTPGTLLAGFTIGYLFMIVSPTPAGIGVVEGVLTLGLRSLNVPLSDATVIALAYRGLTFWLPFLWGILAMRWLSTQTHASEADGN
jgi:uncharacterized protein (TIRG00374 family)